MLTHYIIEGGRMIESQCVLLYQCLPVCQLRERGGYVGRLGEGWNSPCHRTHHQYSQATAATASDALRYCRRSRAALLSSRSGKEKEIARTESEDDARSESLRKKREKTYIHPFTRQCNVYGDKQRSFEASEGSLKGCPGLPIYRGEEGLEELHHEFCYEGCDGRRAP